MAVRQAPDLRMAYYDWGQALLARGDLACAAREFELAHAKGPHFADALKGWGDALARQGHRTQALTEYDEALKYAPSWVALRQARETAARAAQEPTLRRPPQSPARQIRHVERCWLAETNCEASDRVYPDLPMTLRPGRDMMRCIIVL